MCMVAYYDHASIAIGAQWYTYIYTYIHKYMCIHIYTIVYIQSNHGVAMGWLRLVGSIKL